MTLITAIIVVSAVLVVLFIVAAVAGNRAQTRMVAERELAREAATRGAAEPPDA